MAIFFALDSLPKDLANHLRSLSHVFKITQLIHMAGPDPFEGSLSCPNWLYFFTCLLCFPILSTTAGQYPSWL